MNVEQLPLLPLWYVVFLLSLTCHEAAHAIAALRGGDPTAYLGGQVTLNPTPHVRREPIGTVLVPLVSFLFMGWMIGWASAPYDPRWEDRYPRRAAAMALAGPLANLALAAFGFVALKVGMAVGYFRPIEPGEIYHFHRLVSTAAGEASLAAALGTFCSILLSLNLVLFVFNLLPLPPMDGASVAAGLFPAARRARDLLRVNPMFSLIGLLIAWRLFPFVFGPIYGFVLGWL